MQLRAEIYDFGPTKGRSLFNYEIQMIPVTTNADSADYGKYNVTIKVASPASYNSANIGLRWLVTVNKFRNFVVA